MCFDFDWDLNVYFSKKYNINLSIVQVITPSVQPFYFR